MKILVIQLRRVGDILLTTPVLPYLKKAIPSSTVDFLSEPMGKDVLLNNPHLDEHLIYDKSNPRSEIKRVKDRSYDVMLDFLGNPRSAILTRLSGAKYRVGFAHFGRSFLYNLKVPIPIEPEYNSNRKIRMVQHWLAKTGQPIHKPDRVRPSIFLTKEDEEFGDQWLKNENINPQEFAILVPAIRKPIRQWKPEGFKKVGLSLVNDRKLKVYLAWGPGEESFINDLRKGHENELRVLPATNLRQMASIFKRAKMVISNNSGAMHVAVSVDTPTVTMYGPTWPIEWNPSLAEKNPPGIDKVVTARDVACLGCHLSQCHVGHLCMERISAEQVLTACKDI